MTSPVSICSDMDMPRLQTHGKHYFSMSFVSMGSPCSIMFQAADGRRARQFSTHIMEWLRTFEVRYSRFLSDSLISEINRQAGIQPVTIDQELRRIFALCDWYHWSTDGLFDPTMLPLIRLWDYHNAPTALPDENTISNTLALIGWNRVEHDDDQVFLPDPNMAIDLGGIGKEYAVDRVFAMAMDHGLRNLLLNFGCDVRVSGHAPNEQPWIVGLERHDRPGTCWGGVALTDHAVTTSGNYLRKLVIGDNTYGHILDPRTGWPVQNACRSVSIIAPTCTEAGILSTSVFIYGEDVGSKIISTSPGVEGFICTATAIHQSAGAHAFLVNPEPQMTRNLL